MAAKRIAKPLRKTAKANDELAPLRALQRAPAALSRDQVSEIDKRFMEAPYGVARRIGLIAYTLSGKELIAKITDDRETAVSFADMANHIEAGVIATRKLANDLECAAWRIRVALCTRDDMDSVLAEAANG